MRARVERLQKDARGARCARAGAVPALRVLLTGATGFLGKEILSQAADDRRIEEVVAVVRPGDDPRPEDEGGREGPDAAAARRAAAASGCTSRAAQARKFRFVDGDIEKPDLGIDAGGARARCAGRSPT